MNEFGVCHDRYGIVPPENSLLRTCSLDLVFEYFATDV